jgi:hypothetical protein
MEGEQDMFSQEFIATVKSVYPNSIRMHELAEAGEPFIERWLEGSREQITFAEVLREGVTLAELQDKARRIKTQHDLYHDFTSGVCYADGIRDKMCPKLYAQGASDNEILRKFPCSFVCGCIPDCEKYKTGKCWELFDEMGFTEIKKRRENEDQCKNKLAKSGGR